MAYMNKFKVIILMVMIMIVPSLTSCNGKPAMEEEKTELYDFEADDSLDEFIDLNIEDRVFNSGLGADPPKLCFVNKKYIGLLNYNGLLIYDKTEGKLNSAIDINGLGLDRTQGDGALMLCSNDDFLSLNKFMEKSGFIYSFKDRSLSKEEDVSKAGLNKAENASEEDRHTRKYKSGRLYKE